MCKDTIVITNRHLVEGDYLTRIRQVAALHPHAVLLREKDLTDEEYETLAYQVMEICEGENVPCFLHSRFELALKLQGKRIHISIHEVPQLTIYAGMFEEISISCHSLEDVKLALAHGATQIILGTIFETECKKGLKGKGLTFVKEICDYCKNHGDVPVYAIGGITPENLEAVKAAGAKGGCMMSYVMRDMWVTQRRCPPPL